MSLLESLHAAAGPAWPYLVIFLVGFLPTEIWRIIGVLASHSLNEQSEWLVWVKAVAGALVAGVVAKLLISPSGALAGLPGIARAAGIIAGLAAFFIVKRSLLVGLLVGEATLIGLGLLLRG